jgi:hypothetical protein
VSFRTTEFIVGNALFSESTVFRSFWAALFFRETFVLRSAIFIWVIATFSLSAEVLSWNLWNKCECIVGAVEDLISMIWRDFISTLTAIILDVVAFVIIWTTFLTNWAAYTRKWKTSLSQWTPYFFVRTAVFLACKVSQRAGRCWLITARMSIRDTLFL